LQQIFSAVREPSTPLCETAGRYEQFLEGTLAESFLYILEPTLLIHSRKSDVDIVNQAATTASRTYKEISGRDISFEVQGTISDEAYVAIQRSALGLSKLITFVMRSRSQGGVKLVSGSGRITLDNTMEERLRLLEDKVCILAQSWAFSKLT